MAGLYFHIPFCKRLCGYCDFMRSVKLRYMPQVLAQMEQELVCQSNFLTDRVVRTIYFGGGTPSLVEPSKLEGLIERARSIFDCSALEEITVEVNPDDISEDYVARLAQTSVNRISMGIQSADDNCLKFMGRRHTAQQAVDAVKRLQDRGFDNISVDLIFGVDGFGMESLEHSLKVIKELDVQHISAYHLTIEPNTRFGRLQSRGELGLVDEQQSCDEFLKVHNTLAEVGFEHYEVSNFAKPGFRSRHNSSYWTGSEYLGIGPGAHSYAAGVRRWCEQGVEEYAEGVVFESEQLSATDELNEYVMVSLRRIEGINLAMVEQKWGAEERERLFKAATPFAQSGWVELSEQRIAVKPECFLTSDAVITELFSDL